jgi:hypothetical protein
MNMLIVDLSRPIVGSDDWYDRAVELVESFYISCS